MALSKPVRKLIKILESYSISDTTFKKLMENNPSLEIDAITFSDFDVEDVESVIDEINLEFGLELEPDHFDEMSFIYDIIEQL